MQLEKFKRQSQLPFVSLKGSENRTSLETRAPLRQPKIKSYFLFAVCSKL